MLATGCLASAKANREKQMYTLQGLQQAPSLASSGARNSNKVDVMAKGTHAFGLLEMQYMLCNPIGMSKQKSESKAKA